MTQSQARTGIVISENKLVVQLQDILRRIKRAAAVLMHGKMRHRLICKKVWLSLQLEKPADAQRPVELSEQKQNACIYWSFLLVCPTNESAITGNWQSAK